MFYPSSRWLFHSLLTFLLSACGRSSSQFWSRFRDRPLIARFFGARTWRNHSSERTWSLRFSTPAQTTDKRVCGVVSFPQTCPSDMTQYLDLFYGEISLSADGNSYRKCEQCGANYKMFTFLDQVGRGRPISEQCTIYNVPSCNKNPP